MSRKFVLLAAFIVVLVGASCAAFNVQRVKASGTIYIRADGSIEPPTAPIFTADNVTYYFTDNVYESIVVERDNAVIDGVGQIAHGVGYPRIGINLKERNNVTIRNTKVENFWVALSLEGSSFCTICSNSITLTETGISLGSASHNVMYENKFGFLGHLLTD